MQFSQKLEIGLGAATSLAVFLCFSIFSALFLTGESRASDADSFAVMLLLIWLCSLLIAVGAYFNTTKRSKVALTVLLVAAIIVTTTLGIFGFFVLLWSGLPGLLILTSAILSFVTAILALNSRKKTFNSQSYSYLRDT